MLHNELAHYIIVHILVMDLLVQAYDFLEGLFKLRDGRSGSELHNELAHCTIVRILVMDLRVQTLHLLPRLRSSFEIIGRHHTAQ